MSLALLLLVKQLVRHYRPAVSPQHQEKILAIRSELSAIGVATGRSRAKRNGLSAGTSGIGILEAITRLRAADSKNITELNSNESKTTPGGIVFGSNSLFLNVKVKLLKEQSNGVRGVMNLPNPELLNSRPSILVFAASGEECRAALNAGALIVGGEELIPQLIEGSLAAFNRCIATTGMMGSVMKVARVLGPKGLMPSIKTGTLVDSKDLPVAIKTCLQSVPYKIEKNAGLMNMSLGTLSGPDESLMQNVLAVIDHLNGLGGGGGSKSSTSSLNTFINNPHSNRYIQRIYLSTRGHPGIQISLQ